MISIEKNEQFALINPNAGNINGELVQEIEKKIAGLYREGYYNYVIDFNSSEQISNEAISLIKKIHKICQNENGIMVLIAEKEDIIDELDQTKIEDLVIFATKEEAIEAIYLHELENDFREEEDESADEFGEESSVSDYE
jgi:anti-sigma B factor antagonist